VGEQDVVLLAELHRERIYDVVLDEIDVRDVREAEALGILRHGAVDLRQLARFDADARTADDRLTTAVQEALEDESDDEENQQAARGTERANDEDDRVEEVGQRHLEGSAGLDAR